jgi:small subunit ribosomal protein S5
MTDKKAEKPEAKEAKDEVKEQPREEKVKEKPDTPEEKAIEKEESLPEEEVELEVDVDETEERNVIKEEIVIKREGRPDIRREWIPKTELGRRVLKGEFKTIEDVLKSGELILEPEIIDYLVPEIKNEVIYIGGSPGKGGGIRRTATKRTVRMHKSGRRFKLTSVIVAGNEDSVVGLGKTSSREHKTAIEKAEEQAKLNVIRVRKGCGSWECGCGGDHSIPFRTEARYGSVKVTLLPAPKGVGIVASDSVKKIIKLGGIKDIWVKTDGKTATRTNLAYATFEALRNLNRTKGDL